MDNLIIDWVKEKYPEAEISMLDKSFCIEYLKICLIHGQVIDNKVTFHNDHFGTKDFNICNPKVFEEMQRYIDEVFGRNMKIWYCTKEDIDGKP